MLEKMKELIAEQLNADADSITLETRFKEDGKIIGFTMINTYSVTETPADHSIAEFSVLPSYRKKKVATRMMDLLLEQYPGQWQIKYSANNHPAKKLWTGIGARFGAKPISYGEHEEVIEFIR